MSTKSIADHFADQAERQGDAPALIWEGEPISYSELATLAARSAYAPRSRRRRSV